MAELKKLVRGVSTAGDIFDSVNGLIDADTLLNSSYYEQEQGKNLFDKSKAISGFIATNGTYYESGTYSVSEFIPVTVGESYYGSAGSDGMRFITAYDENQQAIQSAGVDSLSFLYVVPAGISFIRVTCNTQTINEFQLEQNSVKTSYEPFGYRRASVDQYRKEYPWAGYRLTTYGDSLTAQNRWQPTVASKTGAIHTNKGVGGSRITGADGSTTAICQTARINTIGTGEHIVIALGGTNDWAQSVPIGSIDDSDPLATFYGGLNRLYLNLTTRLPEARLLAGTPPYSEFIDFASRGWVNGATNNAGHVIDDYAEAVRIAANKWGLPVVDFNAECGWNEVNITTYVEDDGNLLHPNNKGATRMAEIAIYRMKQLKLISA
ncbi:SGNH/GDSL hydrolase family protein [Pseudoalteromonas phage HS6]|uniref:SGNH/GDSL hydrolase family protein n=1 Tax=Pseudoalteromonas phage HS6 TaxID=1357710 RepID=UPI0023295368|nr:SGNH/GDSL hydrolase family protein [Pseudoalteromonas phage HS6]